MISKEQQAIIIKKITEALKDHDLGIIVFRGKNGSLVLYINDPESTAQHALKMSQTDDGPQGVN